MTVVRFAMERGAPLFALSRLDHIPNKDSFVVFDDTTYKVESVTLKVFQVAKSEGIRGMPPLGIDLPEIHVTLSVVV